MNPMSIIAASLLLVALPSRPAPIFEIDAKGRFWVAGRSMTPVLRPGTSRVAVPTGGGFQFDGHTGGISLGDLPALRLTKSMSVSAWVKLDAIPSPGTNGQIVFRGDDRNGLDPYHVTVMADGRVYFGIEDGTGRGDFVSAPIQAQRWTHVLSTLNDKSGELAIWVDGVRGERKKTDVRPFADLDPNNAPGVSIGNVQNMSGPHRQPFFGQLSRIAIYRQALSPSQAGFR